MKPKSRYAHILAALADIADDIRYQMERAFVAGCEAVRRAALRLDFRLYSEDRRIRAITEGLARIPSDKFAVFVVYSQSALPDFTMNFIAALNRHSYNVIIVSNSELKPANREILLRNFCRLLVERINVGRDFGAYKDGVAIAFRHFPHMRRLIVANDSLYYLNKGLDEMMAGLDGPGDFVGVSEVFEHHYHVASFLLSFGPGVLADPAFRRFWACYRPITTRMWAILEGEGELTRVLVDAGHKPRILFQAQALLPKLQCLNAAEIREVRDLFPRAVRDALPSASGSQPVAAQVSGSEFAEAVVKEVMERNQMHAGGITFVKFLGMPLVKRDIVYREVYSAQEVNRIMSDLGEPMHSEIMEDLARRQPPSRLNVLRRLFYRHGHI